MNRYEQLCRAYSGNMMDFKKYKQECHQLALQLRDAITRYYEIPENKLRLRSKSDPKELTDDIYAAMDMQKDTFWHIRFAINLECLEKDFPDENITFEACIKKTSEHTFILKLPRETEFMVRKNEDGYDFSEFLDFLFLFLKGFYENELERFLTSGHLPKDREQSPIGFRFDPIER